jgi:serine/threonine-protein kinase
MDTFFSGLRESGYGVWNGCYGNAEKGQTPLMITALTTGANSYFQPLNPPQMYVSKYPISKDVIYHEWTHGVVESVINLCANDSATCHGTGKPGEMGAVFESLGDTFSMLYGGDYVLTGDNVSRDLSQSQYYAENGKTYTDADYEKCNNDKVDPTYCDKYSKSLVLSHAAYLMVHGSASTVSKLNLERIYFNALNPKYIPHNADFATFSKGILQSCADLAQKQKGGITTADCDVVRVAFTTVGIPVDIVTGAQRPTATPSTLGNVVTLPLAPGVTMEFVRVPAGEFQMGTADDQTNDNASPQGKIYLDEYWIGKYDVTNAQFRAFVDATGYKTTADQVGSGTVIGNSGWVDTPDTNWQHPDGPGSSITGKENYPVVMVSWDDAVAFTKWASQVTGKTIALPTEAQWEKAARGTDERLYPWGDQKPEDSKVPLVPFSLDMGNTEVGKYSPASDSPYGVADMIGYLWQWTSSIWGNDPNKPTYGYPYNPNDGREDQSSRELRVTRGGFIWAWQYARITYRQAGRPDSRDPLFVFRVVTPSI